MRRNLEHRLLRDPAQVELVARAIERAGPGAIVAHDTETGASQESIALHGEKAPLYNFAGAYCTGISVCLVERPERDAAPLTGYYLPVGHKVGNASEASVRRLCEALARTEAVHLLHHATFDWEVLENLDKGYAPSARTIDNQVASWLDDENRPKALKAMGEAFLDEDAGKEKRELAAARASWWENQTHAYKAVRAAYPEIPVAEARAMARRMRAPRSWGELTVEEMTPYAARDATLTYELAEACIQIENVLDPPVSLAREMELQPILHALTQRGVGVDILALESAGVRFGERADAIAAQYEEAYGPAMRKHFGRKAELNIGSADQMAWLIYEHIKLPCRLRTDSGQGQTGAPAIEAMQGHPVIKGILDYRHWSKARVSYTEPFARFATAAADGRVHGHFSSDRTVTGRLACAGPNVMTIPRQDTLPELRACFSKCAPGFERIGFDLKSAELWVTASLTNDPYLIEVLQTGGNMHLDMMLECFGGERDKDRREYTIAKNVNYSMAYEAGMGPVKMYVAKGGFAPDEVDAIAYRLLRAHKKLFRRQHHYSEKMAAMAMELGELPINTKRWPDRVRHFKTPGHPVPYYQALNSRVQGSIAEFMKDVMLEIFRRKLDCAEWLILQVHDELVFDVPIDKGAAEMIRSQLNAISEDICPFKFILEWDAKSWAAGPPPGPIRDERGTWV